MKSALKISAEYKNPWMDEDPPDPPLLPEDVVLWLLSKVPPVVYSTTTSIDEIRAYEGKKALLLDILSEYDAQNSPQSEAEE